MASLILLTVTARYADTRGGQVTFEQTGWRANSVDGIIYPPQKLTVQVGVDGSIVTQLRTADVPIEPPFTYLVTEVLEGTTGHVRREPYVITVPFAPDGSQVDLSTLQPDGTWAEGDVDTAFGTGSGGF